MGEWSTPDKAVIYARDVNAATINRHLERGTLQRIARGVYTTEVDNDPARVVARHWRSIVGHLLPGSVVTGRSAPAGGPVEGVLFVARSATERRTLTLPGLTVVAVPGSGPLPDDIDFSNGLWQASTPRALAENGIISRRSGDIAPWTLSDDELATWIDHLCRVDGEHHLADHRRKMKVVAKDLDVDSASIDRTSELIGAALGNRSVVTGSPALSARLAGVPFDSARIGLFRTLIEHLRNAAPQTRPSPPATPSLAFFEAYFSNFIEGTEFDVGEARQIVDTMTPPQQRPADGHDLLGTFEIVSDAEQMTTLPDDANEFVELLHDRHRVVMQGRPTVGPGDFKTVRNQAGNTLFVAPELVEGTLRQAFAGFLELDSPWERAVYAMFVVSEVHPFVDGNGRIARIVMNTHLSAGGETRIIIPTALRGDYLNSLRRLSRHDDPGVLLKVLRFTHEYTSRIDFSDFDTALARLTDTNAFEDPESGLRVTMPPTNIG